jgi:hypothetical protein
LQLHYQLLQEQPTNLNDNGDGAYAVEVEEYDHVYDDVV